MTLSRTETGRFGFGVAVFLAAIGMACPDAARAGFYSTDTQGTFNTGSSLTTSNTFDLSGDGSALVTISADATDDISVSVAAGSVDAAAAFGSLFIQPDTTAPGPTDSLMSGAGGPYYIYQSLADPSSGNSFTAFSFGTVEYFAVQFTDNGQSYTGYVQGVLDNSLGYLQFSVTDFGSGDPAAGPPVIAVASGPGPVPEPASLSLLAMGAAGAGALRRRRTGPCRAA